MSDKNNNDQEALFVSATATPIHNTLHTPTSTPTYTHENSDSQLKFDKIHELFLVIKEEENDQGADSTVTQSVQDCIVKPVSTNDSSSNLEQTHNMHQCADKKYNVNNNNNYY